MNRAKTRAAILAAILAETRLSAESALLWDLILDAPFTQQQGVAKRVILATGWHYPTTVSRLLRSGLPSVLDCVTATGICYAAAMFDGRDDRCATVAYALGHAGPQAFNRFLKREVGMTTGEFRDTVPFPAAREWMLDAVIRPYTAGWATFAPLTRQGERRRLGPFNPLVAA